MTIISTCCFALLRLLIFVLLYKNNVLHLLAIGAQINCLVQSGPFWTFTEYDINEEKMFLNVFPT